MKGAGGSRQRHRGGVLGRDVGGTSRPPPGPAHRLHCAVGAKGEPRF